ncbi:MAG TPA: DUF1573 domain-containing protein, partial [Salinivirgaceae bacterium]|nr:DUF1573 domain-containing protein [Salinivirgaceae bacterium]
MKALPIITLILGISIISYGQNAAPQIVFEKTEHDFGTIKETDGNVTYRFIFTNIGAQPAVITRVQPTCGCTTSDYTKQPILTNQKGFIEVVFDPSNRPGPFSKSIIVTTNGEPSNLTLKISGNVIPRPRTIEDDYPLQMGSVRLQNTQFSFLNITNTEVAEREIPIINVGNEPVTITVETTPAWLEVKQVPQVLKPN